MIKSKYKCLALIAAIRLLGFEKLAKALKLATPIPLKPHSTRVPKNHKYLLKDPTKMRKNTPLYAQLDLINWDEIVKSAKQLYGPNPTLSFDTTYKALGGKL